MLTSDTLIAWFYFATVDHVQVWGFGPFPTQLACDQHREATVPREVEATDCQLMVVHPEEE